jgi:chromosomal replication initiation ATPase DnaA
MKNEFPVPVDHMAAILKIVSDAESLLKVIVGFPVKVQIDLNPLEATEISLQTVICTAFSVSWRQIVSKTRKTKIVEARHVYAYFSFVILEKSSVLIGEELGRDHSTILHSVRTVRNWVDTGHTPFVEKFNIVRKKFYHEA